jgi:pimeloyl-ACP methyl ester carboxylesterase
MTFSGRQTGTAPKTGTSVTHPIDTRPAKKDSGAKRISRRILLAFAVLLGLVAALLAVFRWQAQARETRTRVEAAPAGGRFVRAGDVELFIQELGPPEAPVVLFVHGMGAWSEIWRETLVATAAAGFHAVAVDLPPFGYSEHPSSDAYGRQDQAHRILGVLDALGASRAILVGHSFGGGPTLEAVLLAPERIRALVLADAAIGLNSPDDGGGAAALLLRLRPLRNALVAATVTNPLLSRRLLTMFMASPGPATDTRVRMLQRPMVLQGLTDAFGDWLLEFLTSREEPLSKDVNAYRSLALPTLILWGEADTTTPLSQGIRLAELIRGSELVILPNVGHMPQIEDLTGFNRILIAFLSKQREAA